MIAAVCAAQRSVDLPQLAAKLGPSTPPVICAAGDVAIIAWPVNGSKIDVAQAVAWNGRVDGLLETLTQSNVGLCGGMFSLAAVRHERLLLARSLFGGRPLYFTKDDASGAFVACSRLGPLVGFSGADEGLDVSRLAAFVLAKGALDERATVFRKIRRVLPGEGVLLGSRDETTSVRASLPEPRLVVATARDWAAELRSQFESAVARATAGCKRVAVLVSGGLDSSALLASLIAGQRSGHRDIEDVLALTLDFDAPRSDRPYLRSLVEALGVATVRVSPEECAHHAFSSMVIDGAPRAWPSAPMDVHLPGVARERGAEVVLTGVGGDFFWDAEVESFGERALAGDPFGAARDAAALLGVYWKPTRRQRVHDFVLRPLLRGLVPKGVLRRVRRARAPSDGHAPDWAGPALRQFARDAFEGWIGAQPPRGRAERMSVLARSSHLADISDGLGQVEAYSNCREEHLFFDVNFARFLASIPSEVVLGGGWLRGVLRSAFRDIWPDCIRTREDKGDFEPAFAAFLAGLRASGELERLLRMEGLGDIGLVEPRRFRASFEYLARNPEDGGAWTRHWPALAVEAFVTGTRNATTPNLGSVP